MPKLLFTVADWQQYWDEHPPYGPFEFTEPMVCSGCGLPAPNPYEAQIVEVAVDVKSDWDDEKPTHWIDWHEMCGWAIPEELFRQAIHRSQHR